MIKTFTALDFETAQKCLYSICQVGIVRFVGGVEVESRSILVRPPENFYLGKFSVLHGITPERTEKEPGFDGVWPEIEPFITGQDVVAHNGFSFDFICLAQVLERYGIKVPEYRKHDTYRIYKSNLAELCRRNRIALNHHDALSDARACGELFIRYENKG